MKLFFSSNGFDTFSGDFFKIRVKKEKNNTIKIENSTIRKTSINIEGHENSIVGNNSYISDTTIVIKGNENKLLIEKGVRLRGANIIIRGTKCKIEIGSSTTFGGVRIVNVGIENNISIGSNCLFSDHIEIWASDTHTIYDQDKIQINPEKPVIIGNNVWVGSRVIILKGVTINSGAIIGMGAIISKNVPPNTISVGSPNKVVRENVNWSIDY